MTSKTTGHLESQSDDVKLIPFLDKRSYNLTALSAGTANNDITIVLSTAVRIMEYSWARLCVRVHSLNMSGATPQTLRISGYGTLPSEEDPSKDFVDLTSPLVQVDITSSTTVPSLLTSTTTAPDAYMRFELYAAQGPSIAAFSAELSACLLLRRVSGGR